jgi:GTP-binding protein
MPFLDRIRMKVAAGKGGNGSMSFRREKFVPKGGPDGGDGGKGGDVVLHTATSVQDLSHFAGQYLYKAADGGNGGRQKCYGKDGGDLVLKVPAGTIVRDAATGATLRDLDALEIDLVVAKGGRGGRGNVHFKTSINQTPRTAEKGEPGESRELELELKLIADVGLVGLPNAGKSTLLSKISEAHPKIAPYPFTTLYPNLGVSDMDEWGRLVVADIPGLIEGAHRGVGLGDEFLRHIERTRVIVHVVDVAAADPVADYRTLRAEMEAYGRGLVGKTALVVANKMDLPAAQEGLRRLHTEVGEDILQMSAATGEGVEGFLRRLTQLVPRREEAPE